MSIDDLVRQLDESVIYKGGLPYYEKMIHKIPQNVSVSRLDYILKACKDAVVLDIGCAGWMHEEIEKVAKECWGIDKVPQNGIKNYIQMDVEKEEFSKVSFKWPQFDLILCGEIIEHLSNPGAFLDKLKIFDVPIILTVPNIGGIGNNYRVMGIENVNTEHVAWYSYHTLKTLVERHGYHIDDWFWCDGEPLTSEGILFVISNSSTEVSDKDTDVSVAETKED